MGNIFKSERKIIPNSSYFVIRGLNGSHVVTYYSFDNREIINIQVPKIMDLKKGLDKTIIHLPMAYSYQIKKYPGDLKKPPGYLIYFYDKHDNVIANYYYCRKDNIPEQDDLERFSDRIDMSNVTKK